MIKVLNIISDTNIGGAGRVLLNYMSRADREHFDVSVGMPRGSLLKEPLEELGTTVYEVDGLADRSYHKDDVKELMSLIRRVEPDIVHTHGALSGRIAGRRCGRVVIYTRHSAFPVPAKLKYPPGRWVNKWVNEHYSDHIIAVSPAAAENLTDAGICEKRITVMMNGVTPVARKSQAECQALREQWGIREGEFVLGILARIEPYKGHMHILEAMKALTDQGRKLRLLVVVLVAAAGLLAWKFAGSNQTVVDPDSGVSVPKGTHTVRYVVELEQLHEQTAQMIAEGDELYERTKKEFMGTVETVEVAPARTLTKNELEGTFQFAEVPERYNVTMEITAQAVESDEGIVLDSGLEVRAGTAVRVFGPGYYGAGYILSVERG